MFIRKANKGSFLFPPESPETRGISMNLFTASTVHLMDLFSEMIEGAMVVDVGAGRGIPSAVALSMGAKKVFLTGSDEVSSQMAETLLIERGWQKGRDFEIIQKDLKDIDQYYDFFKAKFSPADKIVAIQNIGPWPFYANAHTDGVNFILHLKPNLAIMTGYYPDQRNIFDAADHYEVLENNIIRFTGLAIPIMTLISVYQYLPH